jgi:hypothetical protein
MYHWDRMDSSTDEASRRPSTPTARGHSTASHTAASHNAAGHTAASNGEAGRAGASGRRGAAALALQVALDRRDNGGDLGATRDE